MKFYQSHIVVIDVKVKKRSGNINLNKKMDKKEKQLNIQMILFSELMDKLATKINAWERDNAPP